MKRQHQKKYSRKELSHLDREALEEIVFDQQQKATLLEENLKKYKSLFELSDDAIMVLDGSKFIEVNEAVIEMFGFSDKSEVLNIHPSEISPEKQPDGKNSWKKAEQMIAKAIKTGSHHFEWVHTRANGQDFPAEVWLSRVDLDESNFLVNAILRDLTEIKRAERIILKNLDEKEILIKEIHHRVKNNLQLIISLLNLQSEYVKSKPAQSALMESKNRIASISKVHEMLYMTENLSEINYQEYLEHLLSTVISNLPGDFSQIKFIVNARKIHFNINTAVPLGLMINEMVTNSLKYAFPEAKAGTIQISLVQQGGKYLLNCEDDGIGYDHNIDFEKVETLGFQLIISLVEQLNGTINRDLNKKGTTYQVTFEPA